jgi:hypothetical protein
LLLVAAVVVVLLTLLEISNLLVVVVELAKLFHILHLFLPTHIQLMSLLQQQQLHSQTTVRMDILQLLLVAI